MGQGRQPGPESVATQKEGLVPRGFAKPDSEKLPMSVKIVPQSRICPLLLSTAKVVSALACDLSLPLPEGGLIN